MIIRKYQIYNNCNKPFNITITNFAPNRYIVSVKTNNYKLEDYLKYLNVFYAHDVFIGKYKLNKMTEFNG